MEDVVTQHERNFVVTDERFTDDERLGQPFRGRLNLIRQVDSQFRTVAEQSLERVVILWSRNDQDIPNSSRHEGGKRVVDHRLVVDGDQLLAGCFGDWPKPAAGSSGQNDAFHGDPCSVLA